MKRGKLWTCFIVLITHSLQSQPIITQDPRSRVAAEGASVGFSVQAQGSGALHYQWQFNGADIPRAVGRGISFVATASRAGNYSVRVRDVSGNERTSLPAELLVQKRPIVIVQPRNQILGIGSTAVFEVRVNDSAPYNSVQWWHHSSAEPRHPIPTSAVPSSQQLHMEFSGVSDNGTFNGLYWCVISNSVGWAISRRASLNVVGPPRLTSEPQDRIVRRGGTAIFSITIAADIAGRKTRQWYKDGVALPGRIGRSVVIRNAQTDDEGFYYCVVSSIGGSTTSFGAQLIIQ